MIIKKYQAKTETEAINRAEKELGPGVVIMNVRKLKKKGLFSFLKSQMVEVTVAMEEDGNRAEAPVSRPVAKPLTEPGYKEDPGQFAAATERESLLPDELLKSTMERPSVYREPGVQGGSRIEERLENLQTLLEKQLKPAEEEKIDKEAEKEKDELAAFVQLLYNMMLENEVNEKYANEIIDEIEKNSSANLPIDAVLSNVYQKMILKFGRPMNIQQAKAGPKVVFFIGPTGVGKTTTIAKIASRFRVDEKKNIVLLTADTYRIAAAEQLRTYANILEVPFRVIYSEDDMRQALRDFGAYDYIMVDTAGHSHQNDSQRENMSSLIHCVDGSAEREVFLVLSATTKYKDLVGIADSYRSIADYKLIFTKLDETSTLGNLLNLKLHTGAALSYVTCGQNVPDDIENFNPQKTVKQLLGGKK